MTNSRWQRIWDIFHEAREKPEHQRAEFLAVAVTGDPELRAEIDRLLTADKQGKGPLDDSSARPALSADDLQDPMIGERIGQYRIVEVVGEGGMGVVYSAEQDEPIRRRVALKLIRVGMDTREVVARFEAERQALAMMNHPAIAKVLDGGATDAGRPYFVMELVDGVPITEYCDAERLSTRERLDLLLEVCAGVRHAHEQGLIHRDLKPTNVLVSVQDGKPAPKIIDFGVAKAIEQRLTEKTLFTAAGAWVGTPEYMSPEQADLSPKGIDHRTDLYSLGVMLYELLAGALPFDARELRSAAFDEVRRRIREDEPPKPSTRVSLLAGETSASVAKRRRTEPAELRRQLAGDLDWIAMKALEKDRDRRYGSVGELADDLVRHLRDEVVLAGPPSAVYRVRKAIRRHRVLLGFAALTLVFLASLAAVMFVQSPGPSGTRETASSAPTESLVWRGDTMGQLSPDGRYLSFVDWTHGNVAVHDLETDRTVEVSSEGTWETPNQFGDVSLFSPDGEWLAYCWIDQGEGTDLRLVRRDGSGGRILHHGSRSEYAWPTAWTPDGKRLLAILLQLEDHGKVGHEDRIVLISVTDGTVTTVKQLSEHQHTRHMDISPDGRWIAYEVGASDAGSGSHDIALVTVDGTRESMLVNAPSDDWGPVWLPDGAGLVFVSDRSGVPGLWRLPVTDGRMAGAPSPVKLGLGQKFEPKGFTDAGDFYYAHQVRSAGIHQGLFDLETGVLTEPIPMQMMLEGYNENPSISPSGTEMAYVRYDRQREFLATIVVRSLEDGRERVLEPGIHRLMPRHESVLRWSSDGRSILATGTDSEDIPVFHWLDVVTGESHPVGGDLSNAPRGSWPALSRDDRKLFFMAPSQHEILERVLETGAERTLLVSDSFLYRLALSPNGLRLAYLRGAEPGRARTLEVLELDSGDVTTLVDLPEEEQFSLGIGATWTRDGSGLLVGRRGARDTLWRVDASAGKQEKLGTFPEGVVRSLTVRADGRGVVFGLEYQIVHEIWRLENPFG